MSDIKAELKNRGLGVNGTKDDLVHRLANDELSTGRTFEKKKGFTDWSSKKLTLQDLIFECRRRLLKIGGKKSDLVQRLIEDDNLQKAAKEKHQQMRDLSEQEVLELNKLEELVYDIGCRRADLLEYRSHLARHKSEEEYAVKELHDLQDDECIVTSDYKMKILSCFFRENQKKWFGKRGTSMLGFMLTTNAQDPVDKEKGLKDVSFVFMVTNDVLQDEHEVACAKKIIYSEYLPNNIKYVLFVSDGAGCFKSQYHRALQPFWKIWTGVDEISYRITPAGDGKSCLDGMFGRMNTVLASAVNSGSSYWDADTICEAIEASNGLASTQFVRFEPERSRKIQVEIKDINFESILLTLLDKERNEDHQSSTAYKHSGYGSGKLIIPEKHIVFQWRKLTGKAKKQEDVQNIADVYSRSVSGGELLWCIFYAIV